MLICANRIVIYRYTQKDYFSHNSMELDSIEGDTPVFGEEITVCVFSMSRVAWECSPKREINFF